MAMTKKPEEKGIELSREDKKRRAARSAALAWILAGLVLLFFIVTFFKFPGFLDRPL